ncbi:hypothetical protein BOX15_Mlig025817g1 [Macrostomum lignano]|uniref:Uncharacterized protein n=2 Tax=Macrostomum lignano TaxID=282301 RepID=A0A267F4A9_9PLAT|nr:hypothetical protein BOX15_Mlig025817g1 [Macrostomum lignano]
MVEFQSQAMSKASIKAYFIDKEDRITEIRRFSVLNPPDIACLVEKVRALFDIDSSQNVRMQWLDSENERVTFSTSEELADALSSSAIIDGSDDDGTLRVYISCPSPLIPASKNSVIHPDILCDGCNQPVRGYRFKCVICQDFDLCCHCVVINRHCEHPMIMLRRPKDPFICKLSKWNRSQYARRCRQGVSQAADGSGSGTGSVAGVGTSGAAAVGLGDCSSLPTNDCLRVLKQLEAAAMKVLHRQHHSNMSQSQTPCPFSDAAMMEENRCSMPRRDSIASSLAGGGPDSFVDCSGMLQQQQQQESKANQESILNFVHNMSNSLNALLQPLGIEVSYHHHSPSSPGAVATPSDCPLQRPESSAAMMTDETPPQAQPQPPTPPPPPLQRRPLSDTVAKSLCQMQAMGFTDEDGRLTELLLAANGDISRVLDELRQN